MWRFAGTALLFLLANHAVASEFCPDKNPADTDDADEINISAESRYGHAVFQLGRRVGFALYFNSLSGRPLLRFHDLA